MVARCAGSVDGAGLRANRGTTGVEELLGFSRIDLCFILLASASWLSGLEPRSCSSRRGVNARCFLTCADYMSTLDLKP
jgi:hypothetical protein